MPQAGPALVVPCELEGERILALVATAMGELMIDSSNRKEPAWVNLRFGEKLEVKDVPALTTDLSNISRQLGAPIKALIGVNALRHMHVTFDRRGSQFVVRKTDPSAPPDASKVPLFYVRGGGMMMRAAVSNKEDGNALLFVDSSAFYPLALDDAMLKRSGADLSHVPQRAGRARRVEARHAPVLQARHARPPDGARDAGRAARPSTRTTSTSISPASSARVCSRRSASRSATTVAGCGSRSIRR